MSEKIYAWLLHLYPTHFRELYGDEALQLLRDRMRDEPELWHKIRLWADLIADLLASLPREHWKSSTAETGEIAFQYCTDAVPRFCLLENRKPRGAALFLGAVISATAIYSLPGIISQFINVSFRLPAAALQSSNARPAASGKTSHPSKTATGNGGTGTTSSEAAVRHRVVLAVAEDLKRHYVDHPMGQQMANTLLAREAQGDDDKAQDGPALAASLTQQVRDVSHDLHLEVIYSSNPLPEQSTGPNAAVDEQYRKAMAANNCTFESIKTLPHNIGYLKLNSFPDPAVCESTVRWAMASVNHADAVIFDLRDNRGGSPEMVMLVAGYLFDHPEYMYRPSGVTDQCWTKSPVGGSELAEKPIYILTSPRTLSAAEHFSYDLKMLRRATLVGQTTGGATDVGVFHRIDDHFGVGIRENRTINPYQEPDWAVHGVEPNVKVDATDALVTAEELARKRIQAHPMRR